MADKFELIQGDKKTEFDNARAAGAAYSEADVSTRPYVVYSSDDGKAARTIASTSQLGDELVKMHSQASGPVERDFSAAYDLAERSRLVNMVKDQPSYGPEDTRAELLEEVTTEALRAQTAGQGLGPEATRSELLEERAKQNEKDDRKQAEAEAMAAERIAAAVAMTPEQAKARAARDVRDHGDFEGLGDRGASNAYYLRGDMAERAQHNEHYRAELDRVASPELVAKVSTHGDDDKVVDVAANVQAANDAALSQAKDERKTLDAASMEAERLEQARNMTPEQAQNRVARDVREHDELTELGERGESHAYYLRGDMAERAEQNEHYRADLEKAAPALFAQVVNHGHDDTVVDVAANIQAAANDAALSAAKDERKAVEADALTAARIQEARSMTPEQAREWAARDVRSHADLEELGERGESNAYYLRGDMAERAQHNEHYRAELDRVASPELVAKVNTHGDDDKVVDVAANIRAANAAAAEAEKRKRIEAEQLAAGAPNSAEVNATGRELGRGDFIMPRKITSTYVEQDGKFFDKQSNRVAFEDTGKKLSTASVNKETIADMVALAHAKNWESLKLSGSKDFRREAWLQAESQGIKTVGFTPRSEDLAALETLRQSRATNLITPLQERKTQQQEKAADLDRPKAADLDQQKAPRNDLAKNPAALDEAAKKSMATNFEALRSNASFANRSTEDLTKLAYWRGIVAEDNKHQPQAVKDEAVARFDQSAKDPQFLAKLPQETEGRISDRTSERVQQRSTEEHSL